jgi:hypothetical protein
MRKPWGDKFNFLVSLSKDGKYQDLLSEINQAILSDVSLFASLPRYSAKLYFGSVLSMLSQAPTILVTFRIGFTYWTYDYCLLRTYVSPLSLSAVSSHVLVSLLILGSV